MAHTNRSAGRAPLRRIWVVLAAGLVFACAFVMLVGGGVVGFSIAQAQVAPPSPTPLPPTPTPLPTNTATPEGDPLVYIVPTATIVASFSPLPEYDLTADSALWLPGDDPASQITLDGQGMVVTVNQADYLRLSLAASDEPDVMVETFARTLNANPDDPHAYGLVVRASADGGASYDQFGVLPMSQEYFITLKQGDAVTELRGPTFIPATAFRPGLREQNRLGVLAVGPRLWFFLNGQLVDALSDDTLPEGGIGVFVRSGKSDNLVSVIFEQMAVRRP
mgnify:CR=1 FL=1